MRGGDELVSPLHGSTVLISPPLISRVVRELCQNSWNESKWGNKRLHRFWKVCVQSKRTTLGNELECQESIPVRSVHFPWFCYDYSYKKQKTRSVSVFSLFPKMGHINCVLALVLSSDSKLRASLGLSTSQSQAKFHTKSAAGCCSPVILFVSGDAKIFAGDVQPKFSLRGGSVYVLRSKTFCSRISWAICRLEGNQLHLHVSCVLFRESNEPNKRNFARK